MPPRNKRNRENAGLPDRWRYRHGAYYYRVPPGMEQYWDGKKEFRLGSSLAEAHRVYAIRIGGFEGNLKTMKQLFHRVLIEHVPTLAPPTQTSYQDSLKRLMAAFEDNPIRGVRTVNCYEYKDACVKAHGASTAKHDLQVLSMSFSKAIEWGAREDHPIIGKGFKKPSTPPSNRYVEDWEIIEALSIKCRRKRGSVLAVQAYIRIKILTGLRRADLLRLGPANINDAGITVTPRKTRNTTGKKISIDWSDLLKEAVDMATAARPVDISPWLFCNRKGECYINEADEARGWNSMWRRFMDRVLAETKVTERFSERDLRAKCASDAETLEHAQKLLTHASPEITRKVYRRKPERVKPLR